ncbi:hypothetical protein CONPUDRAFT_149230 [Coniophora puteana RWD-64-598 SS2]|uniref:HNH nuclease domain-containing protein n=1 Tax=Coniophora puteana (strain RWD-64-598) TaxID=741705 RepID=A0A5M3N8L7_CONPW|nr:uncharacterized protein CONPUDRAFT_149230 [Coniophora puteana RWD-64-598 SS2]EIW87201.1 hypothetical protein CONPUDRAFT_149230 [Coniophora puteana RWD-64-598 SS2]
MGGFHKDYPRQAADNRELQSCSDTATSGDELYGLTRTPSLHRGATLGPPARRRHPGLHVNVKRARQLDPNKGRCMITGRCTNVVSCHMLSLDTDDKTLTQLEWAWGLGWRRLDVTSPYSTLFVGAEWKALFDSRDWCLIPDLSVLHALDLLTEDRTANRPFRLNKVLRSRSLFKYYFVANSSLEDAIITVESAHRSFALPTELSHVSWSENRQNVHLWLAHVIREVADTGWESITLNDEQVANYLAEAEPVFAPPAEDDWRNWRPRWDRQKVTRNDSRRFSSNDWAALEFRVYLPVS